MAPRVTRRAAAKHTGPVKTESNDSTLQLSSQPATPAPTQKKAATKKKSARKTSSSKAAAPLATPETDEQSNPDNPNDSNIANREASESRAKAGGKRKRAQSEEQEYDELPHNMGRVASTREKQEEEENDPVKEEDSSVGPSVKKQKTKSPAVKTENMEESDEDLPDAKESPENAEKPVARAVQLTEKEAKAAERKIAADAKKAKSKAETQAREAKQAAVKYREKRAELGLDDQQPETVPHGTPTSLHKKKKPTKSETYGLHEGVSPYPNHVHPTPDECEEVYDLLLAAHKKEVHPPPKKIPPPSEFVAGCGEVPSILDALIRTMLSASTNGARANVASKGMRDRFGLQKSGIGKGACDYNAIRRAPVEDLYYAIAPGGLALTKSVNIKLLLDMVYKENQERRQQLLDAKETGDASMGPKGTNTENEAQQAAEIKLAEDENLSLDHHYTLPTYDAMHKFMALPGIGVKTAACVAMFCMQRPCFAIDTHCFRLGAWLGWVPDINQKVKGEPPVDRDPMFSHLEVRVPDHLKYMLHQLFLAHGKSCPRCKGGNHEGSKGWDEGCPIDHLVDRRRDKKSASGGSAKAKSAKSPAKGKTAKKLPKEDDQVDDEEEDEEDDEEMPELNDEEEADEDASDDSEIDDEDDEDFDESPTKAKRPKTSAKRKTPPRPRRSTASRFTAIASPTKPPSAKKATAPKSTPGIAETTPAKPGKKKTPPSRGWKGGKAVNA